MWPNSKIGSGAHVLRFLESCSALWDEKSPPVKQHNKGNIACTAFEYFNAEKHV